MGSGSGFRVAERKVLAIHEMDPRTGLAGEQHLGEINL